ncbi:MAG: hypothetical protein L0271_12105 [Gemmatimonadetes bacterium]|nr:hypothetical protein [Gemmatimonadota bacterium]
MAAVGDSLAREVTGFAAETTLVAYIERLAREWEGSENVRAELELLRLLAIDRVGRIPGVEGFNPWSTLPEATPPPPGLREWLDARADDIQFSEPAAAWFVSTPVFWDLHDRFRTMPAADEIAWHAALAGFPGECEGIAGCYLGGVLEMTGRYLEEHPTGAHREAAFDSIAAVLWSIEEIDTETPLCGEPPMGQEVEPAQLARLRRALEGATAASSEAGARALTTVERLEARCAAGTSRRTGLP